MTSMYCGIMSVLLKVLKQVEGGRRTKPGMIRHGYWPRLEYYDTKVRLLTNTAEIRKFTSVVAAR
jgi:hypothetical protein